MVSAQCTAAHVLDMVPDHRCSEAKTMTSFSKAVINDLEEQLANKLAKELQEEIDGEILCGMLESMGWSTIRVKDRPDIAAEWCKINVRGPFRRFGDRWCFQDARDAAWFGLKWG